MKPLILAVLLMPGLAMAQAGRFLLAVGDVALVRGQAEIRAGVGTPVESGDTIRVGINSNAQIRLSDESIIGLRSGTVLRLDEYFFAGRQDGRERSLFTLLKGGFRTVTGLIGKLQDRSRYAVRTSTSTIGIRGTHYTIVQCDNDCAPGVQNGTYGGVSDGRIAVTNNAADREFAANEFFHVASADSAPQGLIAPPSFLYDRLEGQQRSRGPQGSESTEAMAQSGLNAESRPSEVPAAPAPEPFIVTEERTAAGSPSVVVGATPTIALVGALSEPGLKTSEGGGFATASDLLTSGSGTAQVLLGFKLPPGSSASQNGGIDDSTVAADAGAPGNVINETAPNALNANWGRWTGGKFEDNQGVTTFSSNNQFHYLYGPLTPPEVISAKTGSFALSDTGLGTTPTNSLGQTGTLSIGASSVDFTARTVALGNINLFFSASSTSWNFPAASTPIQIVAGKGAAIHGDSAGTCSGGPCITSTPAVLGKTGIFMGPNGDHLGLSLNALTTSGSPMSAQATRILSCQSAGC